MKMSFPGRLKSGFRAILRRKYLAFLLVSFCALGAEAQSRVGATLGIGFSRPTSPETWDPYNGTIKQTFKPGIVTGVFAEIPLQQRWFFAPSVLLAFKGFRVKYVTPNYAATSSDGMAYLDVPLNLVYSIKGNGNGFRIGAGPIVSFYLGSYHYSFKRNDLGANVFIGYQTPIGFSLKLSYTRGFVNVNEETNSTMESKNRFAALTVGYLF